MSEQNRYQITWSYKSEGAWAGWVDSGLMEKGDTWQDAIQTWIDDSWGIMVSYEVVSETPAEDGRSGIIEIQLDTPLSVKWVGAKFKATLIED